MYVSELWRYPVKSCRGTSHQSLTLNQRGFSGDRSWMIVDQDGRFVTQRHHPQMTQIYAQIDEVSGSLSLRLKDQSLVAHIPIPDTPTYSVTVWDDQCQARPASPDVNRVLSEWFTQPVTLVQMSDGHVRQVDLDYAQSGDEVSFADGFPVLLASESSLDALNTHLDPPIEMERFRANIIIADAEAYAEDVWRQVKINEVIFDLVKPCARCVIPSINLNTARKESYVLEGLTKHRLINHKVIFGQNLIHRGQGIISVGDVVELLA